MKLNNIYSVILWAAVLTIIAMLSSCSKGQNTNAFKVYFYTTNSKMADLYLVQNNHKLGKVPVLSGDPEQLDTARELCVTTYDASTEIDGVDAKGHVIQMFTFKFNDNGSYKDGGGGYLLYDIWQKQQYNLLIRLNGQF